MLYISNCLLVRQEHSCRRHSRPLFILETTLIMNVVCGLRNTPSTFNADVFVYLLLTMVSIRIIYLSSRGISHATQSLRSHFHTILFLDAASTRRLARPRPPCDVSCHYFRWHNIHHDTVAIYTVDDWLNVSVSLAWSFAIENANIIPKRCEEQSEQCVHGHPPYTRICNSSQPPNYNWNGESAELLGELQQQFAQIEWRIWVSVWAYDEVAFNLVIFFIWVVCWNNSYVTLL